MAVLALDLGTNLGWALARAGRPLEFGGATFPAAVGREGLRFQALRNWLHETKARCDAMGDPLAKIVYERVSGGKWLSESALAVSFGYRAVFQAWAEHHRIPYTPFAPQTLKARVAGSKGADKAAMLKAINARGFETTDHNAADAIGLLVCAGVIP
jgi:hypothetical protein